jgi:uncharacterized membrane protein
MRLTGSTTIIRPPADVYAFFSDFQQLPTFMAHLDEVQSLGETKSRWTASAPFGRQVTWDAETVEAVPGRKLAWRSLDGAEIDNRGEVTFDEAPGGRGTELRVRIEYDVPAGALGSAVARFFGEEPHQQVDDDLRRLKQVLETGEVVRSEGAPYGKLARHEFPQHPAQPLTTDELAEVLS